MPASTRVSRETTTCDRADRIVRAHRPVSTTTNCRHKQSAAGAAALLDCVPLAPHFSVLPFTTPTPAQPESTAHFCHSGCELSRWIQACCGHSLRGSGAPEEGFPRVSVISLRCLGGVVRARQRPGRCPTNPNGQAQESPRTVAPTSAITPDGQEWAHYALYRKRAVRSGRRLGRTGNEGVSPSTGQRYARIQQSRFTNAWRMSVSRETPAGRAADTCRHNFPDGRIESPSDSQYVSQTMRPAAFRASASTQLG